ncbi:hypothetical protein AAHA92_19450 [Salvia divinorum]|uniref:TRF2/HOY1 PH-like domain-containing protein n=1 Tax=Salvia divinorum TaxID=28513 RepID=A0ABD1H5D6_SALDI
MEENSQCSPPFNRQFSMEENSQGSPPFVLPDLEEIKSMPLPIGLKLDITESFIKEVESVLSRAASHKVGVGSHHEDKMKASHFPITTFTVGNWKRESSRQGDLTAKFCCAKKKLVWKFLDGPLMSKMEVSWFDITAIKAVMTPNESVFLRVQLAKPPLFFRGITPQPGKHSNWEPADDFTNGQAHLCMIHEATFPPGVLDKHYEELLMDNEHLAELSRRPFRKHDDRLTELGSVDSSSQNSSVVTDEHLDERNDMVGGGNEASSISHAPQARP